MNELRESANRLRDLADQLEGLESRFKIPVQETDIPRAFAKLRAALGNDVHISIRPPHFNSYSGGHLFSVEKWGVYLGTECGTAHGTHEGTTLAEAVNVALAACDQKEGDVEAEIAKVTQAFAEPLPM